jgi:hypothetical protein
LERKLKEGLLEAKGHLRTGKRGFQSKRRFERDEELTSVGNDGEVWRRSERLVRSVGLGGRKEGDLKAKGG